MPCSCNSLCKWGWLLTFQIVVHCQNSDQEIYLYCMTPSHFFSFFQGNRLCRPYFRRVFWMHLYDIYIYFFPLPDHPIFGLFDLQILCEYFFFFLNCSVFFFECRHPIVEFTSIGSTFTKFWRKQFTKKNNNKKTKKDIATWYYFPIAPNQYL